MNTITFHDTTLHLELDTQHEFLLTNKEVALGYEITLNSLSIVKRRNSDELIEGKHWIKKVSATNGGKQKVIHWTKKGIVRLGFFIKSQKAREFRDWAEDYIISGVSNNQVNLYSSNEVLELQQTILEQNKLIANQSKNDVFMNDPSLHNNFLEFLYQANKVVYATNEIKQTSPQLADAHQSLYNFMTFITKRYEKIRGVGKYAVKQITQ